MMADQNFSASRKSLKIIKQSNEWNKLAMDLQILVLTRLPLLDLLRLSFTCKYFHSLLSDPSFALHYDRHGVGHPTLFVITHLCQESMHTEVFKSDILQEGRQWHAIFTWKNPFGYDLRHSDWFLLTYGDGFLCFEGVVEERSLLLVFNPLFPEEHRTLTLPAPAPAMAGFSGGFHSGIAYDRKYHLCCKLVLWHMIKTEAACRIISFVYNFKEGTWKKIPEWNVICDGCCFQRRAPFVLHDRFLCWFVFSTVPVSHVKAMLVFDVEEDSWMDSLPLDDELFLCVAVHKRQLCFIRKGTDEKAKNMNLGLWKFDREQSVWKMEEIIQSPPIPGWEVNDITQFPLIGAKEFLWFEYWSGCWDESRLWVYDISNHSWQSLSKFQTGTCLELSLFRLTA